MLQNAANEAKGEKRKLAAKTLRDMVVARKVAAAAAAVAAAAKAVAPLPAERAVVPTSPVAASGEVAFKQGGLAGSSACAGCRQLRGPRQLHHLGVDVSRLARVGRHPRGGAKRQQQQFDPASQGPQPDQ
ncbi:MAG: hypothetical protein WDW36_003974 [Sanguina aurantia]